MTPIMTINLSSHIIFSQDSDVLLLLFSDGVHEQMSNSTAVKVSARALPPLLLLHIASHFRLLLLLLFKAEMPLKQWSSSR